MRDDNSLDLIGQLAGYGKIATVDLKAGRITVAQGDVVTGPIRWAMGGGGGTKVWSRPKVGEQVLLIAPEGDIAGAIALRGSIGRWTLQRLDIAGSKRLPDVIAADIAAGRGRFA